MRVFVRFIDEDDEVDIRSCHFDNVANLDQFERDLNELYGEGEWSYDPKDLEDEEDTMKPKIRKYVLILTGVVLVIGVLTTYETLKELCCFIGGN